jgi:hypothetical protein
MTEQIMAHESAPKSMIGTIMRQTVKYAVLAFGDPEAASGHADQGAIHRISA